MKYNPEKHHRRSIRLKGYDYSQPGAYFITICTQNRACLFGKIVNGEMCLNDAGKMVDDEWKQLPVRFANIHLHDYVVMPNHFHAILRIKPVGSSNISIPANATNGGASLVGAPYTDNPSAGVSEIENDNNDLHESDQMMSLKNSSPLFSQTGQPQGIAPAIISSTGKTLGDMVGAFQSIVTVKYIRGVKLKKWQSFDKKLWQRNYWEHIIRNQMEFDRIRKYIIDNPRKWTGIIRIDVHPE